MKYKEYNPKDKNGQPLNSRSARKAERKVIYSYNKSLHFKSTKKNADQK